MANGPLVFFCIAGLFAGAHAMQFYSQAQRASAAAASPSPPSYLTRVSVKTRDGSRSIEIGDVTWIEAQGNYLALHVGPAAHLVREGLARIETQLDPAQFKRVHRRTIVAIAHIRSLKPLGSGDAELTLADGTELRVSRLYRAGLQAILG